MKPTTPCIEWPGRISAAGYGREPWGEVRYDEQGRRRGRHSVMVHRRIVEIVEGRPLGPGEIVMHRCDNPSCFRYDHLRRATQADNVADCEAKGRGRHPLGIEHPNAKLTDEQVAAVRRARDRGEPQRPVAARFGVSRTLVAKIERGEHRATCPNADDHRKG